MAQCKVLFVEFCFYCKRFSVPLNAILIHTQQLYLSIVWTLPGRCVPFIFFRRRCPMYAPLRVPYGDRCPTSDRWRSISSGSYIFRYDMIFIMQELCHKDLTRQTPTMWARAVSYRSHPANINHVSKSCVVHIPPGKHQPCEQELCHTDPTR